MLLGVSVYDLVAGLIESMNVSSENEDKVRRSYVQSFWH